MSASQKPTTYLIAFTSPLPGKEAEYNRWYDEVHLPEVTAIPGILSGRRFKLTEAQMGPPLHPHRYMVMYEIENGQAAAVLQRISEAMPGMRIDPVIDMSDSPAFVVESIGDRWPG